GEVDMGKVVEWKECYMEAAMGVLEVCRENKKNRGEGGEEAEVVLNSPTLQFIEELARQVGDQAELWPVALLADTLQRLVKELSGANDAFVS
ncbi:hypothetical protein TeGR_g11312, partial [Tetraparma gracilis]